MQEMLQVADAVAREKNIEKETVIAAMEEAIQKAGRSKYGYDHDIRAQIDRKTGDISLFRYREVVEAFDPENPEAELKQILFKAAKKIKSDVQLGEFIIIEENFEILLRANLYMILFFRYYVSIVLELASVNYFTSRRFKP